MKEMDPHFMDDGDPCKEPQPINWKCYVGGDLLEWDWCFEEEKNSMEDCGSIYGHNDDEYGAATVNFSIDHNGVYVKKRKG